MHDSDRHNAEKHTQRTSRLLAHSHNLRDVIWSGGAIHLHLGKSDPGPDLHAHFALQVTISISSPIAFREGRRGRKRVSQGWLIGSDQPHLLEAETAGITFFQDPLSLNGRRLTAALGKARVLSLSSDTCGRALAEFEACSKQGWTAEDVSKCVDRVVGFLTPDKIAVRALDPRVQTVVNELMRNSSDSASLKDLALRVGLSESRLAHLFRREVGLPMRQYRLSLRMQEAIVQISSGRSFTESAHSAGFSDSAYFARICRRMFGSAPSRLPDFSTD